MPNYWRARINSRIARGKMRMLDHGMGEQCAACPPHPSVSVALCQVEPEVLPGEDPRIDSGFAGDGWRPKIGLNPVLHVKQLPRGNRVRCLESSEQTNRESLAKGECE